MASPSSRRKASLGGDDPYFAEVSLGMKAVVWMKRLSRLLEGVMLSEDK